MKAEEKVINSLVRIHDSYEVVVGRYFIYLYSIVSETREMMVGFGQLIGCIHYIDCWTD